MTMKPWSAEYGAYGKLCRFCKCIEKLCIHWQILGSRATTSSALADKSTMTMSLHDFIQAGTSRGHSSKHKSKKSSKRNKSRPPRASATAAAATPGTSTPTASAGTSLGRPRVLVSRRRRKAKPKSRPGSTYHGHSHSHGPYALNDPNIWAHVAFEERNRQFQYRGNMQQNYFRDFPKF
jgi:hypothetical protein